MTFIYLNCGMKKKIILVRVLRRYRRGQSWNRGRPECFFRLSFHNCKSRVFSFLTNNNKNGEGNNISCKYFSLIFRKTRNTTKKNTINPLSPNIHIQILQTDLYTFP